MGRNLSARRRRQLLRLVRLLLVGVGAVLCVRWLRHIDWRALGAALRGARLSLVLVAVLLTFLNLFCGAERWRIMLAPAASIDRWRIWQYFALSNAASMFLPARGGEALRVYLPQRDGVPLSTSLGVLLVERVFDLLGMLTFYLPLPFLLPLARGITTSIALIAGGALGGILVALWVAMRIKGGAQPADSVWARLGGGLESVRRPGTLAVVLFWSIGQFAVEVVQIRLILLSVGLSAVPFATPGLVLLSLNLAIAVPLTPGHLGTFEAGVVAGLKVVGVPLATALATALIIHGMQVVPVLLAGVTGLPVGLAGNRRES